MTLAERVVVVIVAVCLGVALMLVTTSCAQPKPSVSFAWYPKAATPWCYVDELPEAPELLPVDSDNPDVIARVMVHRRDLDAMIAFVHDVKTWSQQVKECLGKLTE